MHKSSSIYIESLKSSNLNKHVGSINEYFTKYLDKTDNLSTSNLNNNNAKPPLLYSSILSNPATNYVTNDEIISIRKLEGYSTPLPTKSNTSTNIQVEMLNANKYTPHKFKRKNYHFHNPEINKKMFSMSTLKYLTILLVTCTFVGAFFCLFMIALLNFASCSLDGSLVPVYLITMGIAGILRIFLFYACPYSYSNSLALKMYEHLVWRLLINRVKSSYYSAALVYQTYLPHTSMVKKSKVGLLLKCFFSFLVNFVCCNCVCNDYCNDKFDTNSKNNIVFKSYEKESSAFECRINVNIND